MRWIGHTLQSARKQIGVAFAYLDALPEGKAVSVQRNHADRYAVNLDGPAFYL